MIQTVFIDVDGTLTSPRTGRLVPSAAQAIRLARRAGVKVFAATGRHTKIPAEGKVLEGVGLDGYLALNGQLCYLADGTVLREVPMDAEDCRRLMDLSREMGFSCAVVERGRIYLDTFHEQVRAYHERMGITPPEVLGFARTDPKRVLMMMAYLTEAEEAQVAPRLKNSVLVRLNELGCDVIPRDGGKAAGMLAVLGALGESPARAMALGDGENDKTMLKAAGVGVAMAHSSAAVRACADDIAPPVEEDGILRVFQKYHLI